ncbi:MAG TPA: transcriptional repressor [Treponema sp.]|nr:transcriptional repressor [Treponema sp.]
MTRSRKTVLDILITANEPVSAADIKNSCKITFDPATIYRALHYLEQEGYAESFVLHCREHGTERYYTAINTEEEHTHRHWFHCEQCHCFIDVGSCVICETLQGYEKTHNLEIRSHILYLTGICPACKNNALQSK